MDKSKASFASASSVRVRPIGADWPRPTTITAAIAQSIRLRSAGVTEDVVVRGLSTILDPTVIIGSDIIPSRLKLVSESPHEMAFNAIVEG